MLSTIVTIFIFIIIFGVGLLIWESISDSMRQNERIREENQKAEEAREEYPSIKSWTTHPLYKETLSFIIEKVDYFIQIAKETTAGRNNNFRLEIDVKSDGVYITSPAQSFTFYYSSVGYDNIKVGYYQSESDQACNDFAVALSACLKNHYLNENIDISDVNFYIDDDLYYKSSITFWVDLSNLMNRLKQV